jgi:hypothetical protein
VYGESPLLIGLPWDPTAAEQDALRPEHVPGSPGLSQLQRAERLRLMDGDDPGNYPSHCKFSLRTWVTPGTFKPISRYVEGDEDGEGGGGADGAGPGADKEHRKFGPGTGVGGYMASRAAAAAAKRNKAPLFDPEKESRAGEGGGGEPVLSGVLRSEDCGFEIHLEASWFKLGEYYQKAINYSLMVIATVPLQIYLLVRQTEYSGTQAGMAKVSLACMGFQAVLDAYQCLTHLTAGIIVETLFHSFSTAAFFQFTLFSIFEMRVLLQIWKARRPNTDQNWLEIRRDLSILYSRFYGGFLGGFFLMYWLQRTPWLIALLCNSYWLPQIAWNAWNSNKKPLLPAYVLGTSVGAGWVSGGWVRGDVDER